jgi:hypothetical protein
MNAETLVKKWCSVACAHAALRARGHYAAAGQRAWSLRPTTEAAVRARLASLGATPGIVAACLHERYNAYRAGYDMGRRKGFADALREAPEIRWRKGAA